MNITDFVMNMLPAKVTRKNKSYNLVITKTVEGGEERVKVGYQHEFASGKTEVLTCADRPAKNDGFRLAVQDVIHGMMSDGWVAMGYKAE